MIFWIMRTRKTKGEDVERDLEGIRFRARHRKCMKIRDRGSRSNHGVIDIQGDQSTISPCACCLELPTIQVTRAPDYQAAREGNKNDQRRLHERRDYPDKVLSSTLAFGVTFGGRSPLP